MDYIIKKNEAEINENVAKGLLCIWGMVLLVDLLCWFGIFNIYFDMTVVLMVVSLVTLFAPAVIILKFHFYNDMMKYLIVTATAIMAGTSYVLFTFNYFCGACHHSRVLYEQAPAVLFRNAIRCCHYHGTCSHGDLSAPALDRAVYRHGRDT